MGMNQKQTIEEQIEGKPRNGVGGGQAVRLDEIPLRQQQFQLRGQSPLFVPPRLGGYLPSGTLGTTEDVGFLSPLIDAGFGGQVRPEGGRVFAGGGRV